MKFDACPVPLFWLCKGGCTDAAPAVFHSKHPLTRGLVQPKEAK